MQDAYKNVPPLAASQRATADSLDKEGTAICKEGNILES